MLNYFLLGALFIYFIIPIIDNILHIFQGIVEVYTAKCNLKIAEANEKIAELHAKGSKPTTHKIGFQSNVE